MQKNLARSLGLIADQGAMYGGKLGQAIDSAMRENSGYLTADDLSNNRAEWRDTVGIDYRGYQVVTAPPPATSWNALLRLGMMGQFGLKASDHNSAAYLHTFTEVSKQASQASRDYAADPEIKLDAARPAALRRLLGRRSREDSSFAGIAVHAAPVV